MERLPAPGFPPAMGANKRPLRVVTSRPVAYDHWWRGRELALRNRSAAHMPTVSRDSMER
jgi:hypothetical protein